MQLFVKRRHHISRSRSFSFLRTSVVCLAQLGRVQILKVPVSSRFRLSEVVWVTGVVSLDEGEGGSSVVFFAFADFFEESSELI